MGFGSSGRLKVTEGQQTADSTESSEQHPLDFEKHVIIDFFSVAQLSVVGEVDKWPSSRAHCGKHAFRIVGLVDVVLVGNSGKWRFYERKGVVPVVGNAGGFATHGEEWALAIGANNEGVVILGEHSISLVLAPFNAINFTLVEEGDFLR